MKLVFKIFFEIKKSRREFKRIKLRVKKLTIRKISNLNNSNFVISILYIFTIEYRSKKEITLSIIFFMKKILLCSEFYYPQVGGVEIHNKILFDYFKKNKFKVYVATSFNAKRLSNNNIFEFKIKGNFVRGYSGETKRYQDFLIKENFDLIFFNAAQQWSFDLALPVIENINSKKILFPCGFSRLGNYFYFPYFKLIKLKIDYFDEIICSYKTSRDYKFLSGIFKKKIHLIHNGSEKIVKRYNHKKIFRDFKIKPNTQVFMNVSNIKFNKGQERVISLFDKIPHENSILFLMGQNHSSFYFVYIKILIFLFNKKNKGKKIYLLPPNNIIKQKLYSISNFFLFGSRLEYDPLVMYEAIVSKTKFISNDVGSCKNVINDNYGLVSNDDDKKIQYILRKIKTNRVKNLSVKNFFWNTICKKYFGVFEKYLK